MEIDDNIFLSYLNCKYKAFLKYNGEKSSPSKFEIFYESKVTELKCLYQERIADRNFLNLQNSLIDPKDIFNSDFQFITNSKINLNNKTTSIDAIEIPKVGGDANQTVSFSVIAISPRYNVTKEEKLLLTYKSFLLESISGRKVNDSQLLYGYDLKSKTVRTEPLKNEVLRIISAIEGFSNKANAPDLRLNKHCQLCEFENLCYQEAIKKDDLSLLKTLKEKEIRDFHKKGIFTVTQLSYTFRPRRQLKKVKRKVKKHHASIKALAIREQKVFIYEQPIIPSNSTKVYLDVEGIPDQGLFYLIGMIIEYAGNVEKYSLWINDVNEVGQKLIEFINKIRSLRNITIYHYGSFETKFFKLLATTFPDNGTVKRLIDNSVNIVSYVYPSIYFPTYSNGLKDIAKYLGFKWANENVTGLESILLRQKWELNRDTLLRQKLIEYNIDDCHALMVLTNFLQLVSFSPDNLRKQFPLIEVTESFDSQIRERYGGHKFDDPNFTIENFDYINKCSYFDYQRNKIFLKTDEALRKSRSRKQNHRRKFNRIPNTEVVIKRSLFCPKCESTNIRVATKVESKIVVDIKFFKGGVKKWITKYNSQIHHCRDCSKSYFPSRYKKIGIKYGHNLISWVVYQNLVNGISFGKIEKTLADTFQISVGSVGGESIYRFKSLGASYYEKEYNRLVANIKNWNIIHTDETKVRVQGLPGYIWVFTNMTDVAFIYTETRKSDFIKKLVKGFKGVLISDFYKGYEGLDCEQQKCLVHLIRDINDTLFKHQLNLELKQIAQNFSVLLKGIVDTTKQHGLKKRYLLKHQRSVSQFYKFLEQSSFKSDEAQKIYNRFIKFKSNLFLFLEHDGVPWNNNNAEHAFKHFATYRRGVNGIFTKEGLKRYLILLSIYETCKYRNINFFKFLLSKEKYIDVYLRKYTNSGNLKKNCDPHRNEY